MDDGLNGDFTMVYDGKKDPFTLQFTTGKLATGLPYKFKVASVNLNGNSPFSPVS